MVAATQWSSWVQMDEMEVTGISIICSTSMYIARALNDTTSRNAVQTLPSLDGQHVGPLIKRVLSMAHGGWLDPGQEA